MNWTRLQAAFLHRSIGLYNWLRRPEGVSIWPEWRLACGASARNLILSFLLFSASSSLPQRLATLRENRLTNELYRSYSQRLFRKLNQRLAKGFDAAVFVALCEISTGWELESPIILFRTEILNHIYCLLLTLRKGLSIDAPGSFAERSAYLRVYRLAIEIALEVADTPNESHLYEWLRLYSSPPTVREGSDYLPIAQVYRQLEKRAANILLPPFQCKSLPADRLRIGILRIDYALCPEVNQLISLLASLPAHIDFYLIGRVPAPGEKLADYPYIFMTDDVATSVEKVRDLNLDAALFSQPYWGHFCSFIPLMIAQRVAPKQIYFLGDITTSGLPTLDYLVAPTYGLDQLQEFFMETLLPVEFGHPIPPALLNPVQINKNPISGVLYVTNCHSGKITKEMIESWAEILGPRLI